MASAIVTDALKQALDMEKKGYEFYNEMSEKSENDITKKTFAFLAKDEMLHLDSIKKFHEAVGADEKTPAFDLNAAKKDRGTDRAIFSERLSDLTEKIKRADDDKKAFDFAMEFENNGYRYYQNMLKEAKDENLIRLLNFLIEEENEHYELIKRTSEYLTDPAHWFMSEEGSFPQG
ncbi:ferritin family protein [Candidatus Omnitrophota bacterium]